MSVKIGVNSEIFDLVLLSDTALQRRMEIESQREKVEDLLNKIQSGEIHEKDLSDDDLRLISFEKRLDDYLFNQHFEKISSNTWKNIKTGNYLSIYFHVEKEINLLPKPIESKHSNMKKYFQTKILWNGFQINFTESNGDIIKRTWIKNREFQSLIKMLETEVLTLIKIQC